MKILKYKKFKGLYIVCKKCNRNIEVSQDEYKGCNHPLERQKYKAIITINKVRKTKDLKTLDYDTAVKQLLEFKEELANPVKLSIAPKVIETKPELLTDCIMMYSDWLENIDIPKHQQKNRSNGYVKATVRYVLNFADFLVENKFNLNEFSVHNLNDELVGKYYEHLEKISKSDSTFNSNTKAMKSFNNYLIDKKKYLIPNYFKEFQLKYVDANPLSIQDDDFIKILNTISNEDSVLVFKSGAKKNMYRPYIKEAIELVAYTGMRIEETMILKYSDIVVNGEGKIEYVIGTDLKFERTHNYNRTKQPKKVLIPITRELEDLLNRLDYKKYLGCDRYLIANDENIKRKTIADQLSDSFTFYKKKAGISSEINLKHLRKTFLTKLHTKTGFVESMGYQRSAKVTLGNYIDKAEVVKKVNKMGFNFFEN